MAVFGKYFGVVHELLECRLSCLPFRMRIGPRGDDSAAAGNSRVIPAGDSNHFRMRLETRKPLPGGAFVRPNAASSTVAVSSTRLQLQIILSCSKSEGWEWEQAWSTWEPERYPHYECVLFSAR